jgi:hypothetical protein
MSHTISSDAIASVVSTALPADTYLSNRRVVRISDGGISSKCKLLHHEQKFEEFQVEK